MTDVNNAIEKRHEPRLPFPMRAVPLISGSSPWKVIDVSPGGAGLIGDASACKGDILTTRLTAPFLERPGATIEIVATLQVIRYIYSESNEIIGLGAAWLGLVARGPGSALRDFLRGILCISDGYIRNLSDENTWEYTFARAARSSAPPETPVQESGTLIPTGVGRTPQDQERVPRLTTSIHVMFPITFQTDKAKGSGFAVKVMDHAMRIATLDIPPAPYMRITTGIKIGEQVLELAGTVGNVKNAANPGAESRFDVQLSLGNNPNQLAAYRKHIEKLSASSGTQS